eukprot:758266-Hanusia_phi.AAC.2
MEYGLRASNNSFYAGCSLRLPYHPLFCSLLGTRGVRKTSVRRHEALSQRLLVFVLAVLVPTNFSWDIAHVGCFCSGKVARLP